MKTEKNKLQRVLESMEGSQRAKPKPELWGKIEEQIEASEAKLISIQQWRIVAAAVLLLSLNLFALYDYTKNVAQSSGRTAMDNSATPPLISDYQIYEE